LALYKPVKLNRLQKRRFLVLRNWDRVADVEASEDEGFPCVLLMGFHHQKRGRVLFLPEFPTPLRFRAAYVTSGRLERVGESQHELGVMTFFRSEIPATNIEIGIL
jgi:hypothetical protein